MIIESIIIFLVIILLLVVSHELGHFLTAKLFGVRVDEFGLGIPPRIWSVKYGETLYSLNLLPFGGFVRIFGEEEDINNPRSFSAQSYLKKSLIVAAGVISNILMAYLIFTSLVWIGSPEVGIIIQEAVQNSPAEASGLQRGDIIAGIGQDYHEPKDLDEVQSYIEASKGKEAFFRIKREDKMIDIQAIPRVSPPEGQGSLGIVMTDTGIRGVHWYQAPWEGLKMTYYSTVILVQSLVYFFSTLVSSGQALGDVVGPVGIAVLARETFSVGIFSFFQLLALLSLNLAIINILPIPALDGGRLLFFVIEKIIRRPIPSKVASTIHSVFFIALIVFLIWVTQHDIANWDRYIQTFNQSGI
jgi:regulator of sigma E protease